MRKDLLSWFRGIPSPIDDRRLGKIADRISKLGDQPCGEPILNTVQVFDDLVDLLNEVIQLRKKKKKK